VYWRLEAEGQPVQYLVLNIAHIPLYQSGMAGRSWRKTRCSFDIWALKAAVFVDGILSRPLVRFQAVWFAYRS
jgi:hypothetical protein